MYRMAKMTYKDYDLIAFISKALVGTNWAIFEKKEEWLSKTDDPEAKEIITKMFNKDYSDVTGNYAKTVLKWAESCKK